MKQVLTIVTILLTLWGMCDTVYAYDTYNSVEYYRHYGKQQIKDKDSKGNTVFITPNFNSYAQRNETVSEKIVAIYDKRSPAYGYRYVIYTPIMGKVMYHKIMQPSPNGYGGYVGVPDGDITGISSQTPCFPTIQAAKAYYYPQYFKDTTKPVLRK